LAEARFFTRFRPLFYFASYLLTIICNLGTGSTYGYDHPPRAARDVREQGIPLKTMRVVSTKTGRKIGAYTFDDPSNIQAGRIGGRKAFSKDFKAKLIEIHGSKCTLTGEHLEARYLQVDHRIPYEVAGDDSDNFEDLSAYMLLDASAQRAKSFSCEACKNWKGLIDHTVCRNCYWAYPEKYTHVAMEEKRTIQITWTGKKGVAEYSAIDLKAKKAGKAVPEFIKDSLKGHS
jgi:hypothetical protein